MTHIFNKKLFRILALALITALSTAYLYKKGGIVENPRILHHVVNLKKQNLGFYYQNESGKPFVNFSNLKSHLEEDDKELVFAMNGGMFSPKGEPQGLYIEKGKNLYPIDQKDGNGNFYLKPNGIFLLQKDGKAQIIQTSAYKDDGNTQYATQSGPMLLIDGKMHPALREGSKNLHIRNGVGILPNGSLLFAMSKERINFWDFATFFKNNGCKNALYLDGFVSKTYLPSKGYEQLDGQFGVIIAEWK